MNRRELIVSASLLSLVAATGLMTSAQASATEAVIVLARQEQGAASYDPIRAVTLNMAAGLIYDRLIEQAVDQSYHPHLAESWETSADGMSWTFKLRKNVSFTDGEPFNAATIVWWIPKFKGTENEYMVDAIDRVEAMDEHTVRFVLKRPEPNLIFNLAMMNMGIPSPKAFDAAGTNYGVIQAVGTGPYKLENFVVGQETVLVSNEDYAWGSPLSENQGAPHIKRLTVRELPDASTAFLELRTGGVDMLLDLPTDFLPQIRSEADIDMRDLPGYGITFVAINTQAAPFTDIRVRQATALAIDQAAILKSVYGGVGKEAHQLLVSTLQESKVDPAIEIRSDPARAAKLLDEAGWAPGADGIRSKDGKPLQVKLWARADTEYRRTAEIIQAQLKAIGIATEITVFDAGTYRDQFRRPERELVLQPYSWTNADILDWFFSAKRLDSWNLSMWDDAKSEELHDLAMYSSRTWDERVANFRNYHAHLLANFVAAPVHEPAQTMAFNKTRLAAPQSFRAPYSIVDIKPAQ
ncbi:MULTISPECIES: ABC transporter substrate-binding protein [Hyphomicrobiales]|jgi:peptide/nickel transport system substrate-binding protein|uniref:ABC transporter substrate-binding protein n=1 Tax=Hyphomicrobiales TaxID=356 RepID=UPI00037A3D2E|nr:MULTISPECIES: ABC transporter substrate-binding protein [Phyllobacteriaceae]MCX8571954.1 ABC transporter substrate-binding protein [Aminobacter sp. MET-1]